MSTVSVRRLVAVSTVAAALALSTSAAAREPHRAAPRSAPAASSLSVMGALFDGFFTRLLTAVTGNVIGKNGAGIDPNGNPGSASLAGDNGAGIDPNGGDDLLAGDNGAGIDPNGRPLGS